MTPPRKTPHWRKVLELLLDRQAHAHHEIYALNVIGHSRISDLRAYGCAITHWVDTDDGGERLDWYRLDHVPEHMLDPNWRPTRKPRAADQDSPPAPSPMSADREAVDGDAASVQVAGEEARPCVTSPAPQNSQRDTAHAEREVSSERIPLDTSRPGWLKRLIDADDEAERKAA